MKLFITNKSYMDEDLDSLAKQAHQLAFKELRKSLLEEENVPLTLYICEGIRNYYFDLKKCDTEKEIYQYVYRLMVLG